MGDPTIGKNEVQCPHCGHFVGPSSRCSNCGMRLEKRMGLRVLRASALLVAVGGLFLLQLYARHRELPLVAIGDVSPAMNFATVRIRGMLESDARRLRSGSVLYVVDDGTGTIAVFADARDAEALPKAGSQVLVSGNLSVGAGNEIRMRAQSAEHVVLEAPPVADDYVSRFQLSEITADRAGDRMTVSGRVSKVWKPKDGSKMPFKIVLEDRSGTLDVVHWLKEYPPVAVGDRIEVTGTVNVYQETLQLKVWNAEDIHPLEKPTLGQGQVAVASIGEPMEKKVVVSEGVLGAPRSIPGGVVYPLTDGSGTIPLVLWDRNVSGEERDALDEGVRVRVTAPVGLYKGEPQLVPADVGGFQIVE
jgi:DNA/RNA endonuclease YhcR with UshA esterase domain